MATNFPTSVDNFTNPTANDSLNLPSHSTQHANANDAIEAVETYLLNGGQGLTWLNTTVVASQASVTIDSLFTSTYDNYRVEIDITAASNTTLLIARLRDAGADQSSGYNYYNQMINTSGTNVSTSGTSDTSVTINNLFAANGLYSSCAFDIKSPFLSGSYTHFLGNASALTGAGLITFGTIGGMRNTAASSSGLKIGCNAGTFSGTIRVYGYRNS
jgi:hypothetical protein